MSLTNFQQEFLLEMLSGEYFLEENYQPAVKDAVKRYAKADYTSEDIDFLSSLPQSLTADLYLTHHLPLKYFATRFLIWLNILEYDLTDQNEETIAYLPNPDPSSAEKILRLKRNADGFAAETVPLIYFSQNTRSNQTIAQDIKHPLSIWKQKEAEYLLRDFLNFAAQNPAKIPSAHTDYLSNLENNLKRTKDHRLSWEELRQKMIGFPEENDEYVFLDRSLGLITPSTLQILSLLSSKPVQRIVKRIAAPQSPSKSFTQSPSIIERVKNALKNSASLPTPSNKAFPATPLITPKMRPKAPSFKMPGPRHTRPHKSGQNNPFKPKSSPYPPSFQSRQQKAPETSPNTVFPADTIEAETQHSEKTETQTADYLINQLPLLTKENTVSLINPDSTIYYTPLDN